MPPNLAILMISPQFSPLVGGYERAAERLSAELGRQGHEVTVVAERRDVAWPAAERRPAYSILRLWCIYRPGWHILTALLSLSWFLLTRGHRYQIIHVHQYGYHAAVAIAYGKMVRKPTIFKTTSTGAEGISKALMDLGLTGRFVAALNKRVDACVATTSTAQEEAAQFGVPRAKIVVLPNGLDVQYFSPCSASEKQSIRDRLHIKKPKLVLFCGRLSPEKNPEGLIQAWRTVHEENPDAELALIGEGPLEERVRLLARAPELDGTVSVVGAQEEVLPWYQAADLFVLPSHHEGLSNSLLEAMSCQLPVVSTRVSGSSEILSRTDAGVLVDVDDMAALAKAIGQMLRDPVRSKYCGENGRTFVREGFSIETVATATVSLYQRLLC